MTKKEMLKIIHSANSILWLWREVIRAADVAEPVPERRGWYKQEARQAYQDSIIAMKTCGLIEDYDVLTVAVRINGEWHDDRRQVVFTPAAKRKPKAKDTSAN